MGLMKCPLTTFCVASGHGLSIMEFAFLALEEKNDHNRAGVDRHGLVVVGCLFVGVFSLGLVRTAVCRMSAVWQCNRHLIHIC